MAGTLVLPVTGSAKCIIMPVLPIGGPWEVTDLIGVGGKDWGNVLFGKMKDLEV